MIPKYKQQPLMWIPLTIPQSHTAADKNPSLNNS